MVLMPESFLNINVNDIVTYFILVVLAIIQTVFSKTQNTKGLLFKNSLNEKMSKIEKIEITNSISGLTQKIDSLEVTLKLAKEKIEAFEIERKNLLDIFNNIKISITKENIELSKSLESLKNEVFSSIKSTNTFIKNEVSVQIEKKFISSKKQGKLESENLPTQSL